MCLFESKYTVYVFHAACLTSVFVKVYLKFMFEWPDSDVSRGSGTSRQLSSTLPLLSSDLFSLNKTWLYFLLFFNKILPYLLTAPVNWSQFFHQVYSVGLNGTFQTSLAYVMRLYRRLHASVCANPSWFIPIKTDKIDISS